MKEFFIRNYQDDESSASIKELYNYLCNEVGLNKISNIRQGVNDPIRGLVEFAKSCHSYLDLKDAIKEFYIQRNFQILKDDIILEIKYGKKEYWVHVREFSTSFLIWIHDALKYQK